MKKNKYNIPESFVKCEVCGEYNGRTLGKNLNWKGSFRENDEKTKNEYFEVRCLCRGILCGVCKKNKIHRPISNSYSVKTNSIWHYPYFMGWFPCSECRMGKLTK